MLWDVRNEYLYLTVESEGMGSVMRPWAIIESKPAIEEAKSKAIVEFKKEFIRRWKNLKGR